MSKNKFQVWRTLLKKSEDELSQLQSQFAKSELGRKQIADQKERLVRMKAEYLEEPKKRDVEIGFGHRFILTINFINHLDKAISALNSQLAERTSESRQLKAKCESKYRTVMKFGAMYERAVRQNRVELEKLEEKDRDSINLSRFNAKS